MAKRGRRRLYHKFDEQFKESLTPRQRMYLESNYGPGVYGNKKYKQVLQELKMIKNGATMEEIDFLQAKREFDGDRRIFNNVALSKHQKIYDSGLANEEGEILDAHIEINDQYSLAYLVVPGYNNSPIQVTRIIPNSDLEDFNYEK